MQREQDFMLAFANLQQSPSHQRTSTKIKRAASLIGCDATGLRLTLVFRQQAKIKNRQIEIAFIRDYLKRLAFDFGECRSQGFMAADYFSETLFESGDIKIAFQMNRAGEIVKCAAGFHSVYKPHPLLRERKRQRLVARRSLKREGRRRRAGFLQDFNLS